MSTGGGTKAILAAFVANLGIAVAKFGGFLVTGSSSMLAESVHSVADTGNQALLLLGGKRSRRDATPQHPFGFGRERYFWSFIVALVLFMLGGVFAIYEGIEKITHPHEIESAPIAIGILLIAIVAEGLSFRTAFKEAAPERAGSSLLSYIRRSKNPELPVVLLEDLGALCGLVLALGALSIALITDEPRWDGIGTLCIGVLLVIIAILLAVEMKSLLIGESATPAVEAQITGAIQADAEVTRVLHLRTEHLGPDELLVGVKVAFLPHLDAAGVATAIDRVEAATRAEVPAVRLLYVEPDLDRSPEAAPATTSASATTTPTEPPPQKPTD